MRADVQEGGIVRRRLRRFVVSSGLVLCVLAGVGYTWTLTPSYSLYRIKQALETHDYPTFSRYVDVGSVLDHAFDEFIESGEKQTEEPSPRGLLGRVLRKGFFKDLARETRPVMKAGLEILIEQAIKDPDRSLPQIPAIAVIGALWHGTRQEDTVSFPVKLQKGKEIEVKVRQAPEGLWRVVQVSNLSALIPALQPRQATNRAEKG
jgi:hypothetical protein